MDTAVNHYNITQRLAQFISHTRWEDVPKEVRHEGKRAILNFFGTAIGGCREPAIDLAIASLSEFSGGSQATIIGRSERIDTLSASFLNAASANIADFDDTHIRTVIHPTAPVAPTLLALGERKKMTGEELLTAFAVGVEVECRIGNAISPMHYRKGWHITATCGILGSAGAASKALGLDEVRTVYALGNAATQSAGLVECLGTMAKSISIGNASRNGLWSALLAQSGFTAPPHSIEGPQGLLAVMADIADMEAIVTGLGESWELTKNAYKPYPCGVVINPIIDGCLALREATETDLDHIEQVLITGSPLLAQRADRPEISSGREAQVSAQHAAAVTLLFGEPDSTSFTDARVQDPRVGVLRRKIVLRVDPTLGVEAARITLRTTDAREHTIDVKHARGGLERPLTDAELESKFESLAASRISRGARTALVDKIWTIESSANIAEILSLTIPFS